MKTIYTLSANMKLTITSLTLLLAIGAVVTLYSPVSRIAAINQHILQQATLNGGEEAHRIRQLAETNLDRDDEPEVTVLYGLACGNDTLMFLAVFEKTDADSWYLVDQIYLGGRGLRHIDEFVVEPESIRIYAHEFQGADPLCGPSQKVVITVTVTHGLLHISRVEAG
ncbi:MAG: hypothetical protein ACYSWO_17170 [Planctomycetota bacterium]|jgi:hypothetical protein